MDKSGGAIDEQTNNLVDLTSQKSKKKHKNKKINIKDSVNSLSNDNSCEIAEGNVKNGVQLNKVAGDTMNISNGLTEKFEHNLNITGDGIQMNGSATLHTTNKCNSSVNTHVAHNGHENPASVNATNNKSMDVPSIALTDQQLPIQEIAIVNASKKSKSKNNKQKNKETNLIGENRNVSQQTTATGNLVLDNSISKSAEAMNVTSITVQLKNGFHTCLNEFEDKELPCKNTPEECTSTENGQKPAQKIIDEKSTKAITTAAVTRLSTLTNISVNDGADARLQQKQVPEIIATQKSNNNPTNAANPPTATIQNTNSNTAKQDEEDIAQHQTSNSKTLECEAVGVSSVDSTTNTTTTTTMTPALDLSNVHIEYKEYESELQMHDIMRLIQAELSEPYSIYTYRYFIYNWPKLCFLAAHGNEYVGAIVCKLDMHMNVRRGYIAMLAVRKEYRKLKIGTTLVQKAIEAMLADNADEVVLETEMRNVPALRLYENLGFVRDKRLFRYYLNGVDALRLKLWFR